MEYHIEDKRLIKLVTKFLNLREKPNHVCDYLVDYDYDFDKLVVNIFFNKDLKIPAAFLIKTKVKEEIEKYFRITPFIFSRIGDC